MPLCIRVKLVCLRHYNWMTRHVCHAESSFWRTLDLANHRHDPFKHSTLDAVGLYSRCTVEPLLTGIFYQIRFYGFVTLCEWKFSMLHMHGGIFRDRIFSADTDFLLNHRKEFIHPSFTFWSKLRAVEHICSQFSRLVWQWRRCQVTTEFKRDCKLSSQCFSAAVRGQPLTCLTSSCSLFRSLLLNLLTSADECDVNTMHAMSASGTSTRWPTLHRLWLKVLSGLKLLMVTVLIVVIAGIILARYESIRPRRVVSSVL